MTSLVSQLHHVRFASPWLLLALGLLPLWSWLRGRYAPVAAVQFSSSKLLREASRQPRFRRGRFLLLLRFLAVALLIVAWARPQLEKGLTDREAMGINLMLALDFSGTMKTKDFLLDGKRASRAEAMKKVFAEFIRARENDRVGVVRFDAGAALVSPLTLDHDWLLRSSRARNRHGTNVGDGMVIAANALLPAKIRRRSSSWRRMPIISAKDRRPAKSPEPSAPLGIKMHVIQIVDFKDMGGYVACGPLLQEAAKITGGQFFQVADANGLRNVYRQIDQLEKTKFKENKQKTYHELLAWLASARSRPAPRRNDSGQHRLETAAMKFEYPLILILAAAVVPAAIGCYFWTAARPSAAARGYRGAASSPATHALGESGRRRGKAALFAAGLMALLFALARPQFGLRPKEIERTSVDFILALDLSRSMLAEDAGDGASRLKRRRRASPHFLIRWAKTAWA